MTPKANFYADQHRRPFIRPPKWDGIPAALRDKRRGVLWRL